MTMKTAFAATIAGFMLAAGPATIANAQDSGAQSDTQTQTNPEAQSSPNAGNGMQMAPAETPNPDDFTDQQVELFAEAYIQVRQIGMSYNQPIQQAADEQERRTLIQEAQTEMVAVIEDIDGLTVDDYNGINAAAQANQSFAQDIQTEITDLAGTGANGAAGGQGEAEGGMDAEGDAGADTESQ